MRKMNFPLNFSEQFTYFSDLHYYNNILFLFHWNSFDGALDLYWAFRTFVLEICEKQVERDLESFRQGQHRIAL